MSSSAPAPHRFTVAEYYRMGDAGFFDEDARLELIDGEVIDMCPIGGLHARIVDRLTRLFVLGAPDDIVVRVQNPVRLSDLSEPVPDLVLAVQRDYGDGHPTPPDVLLVVEVADTTLRFDRGRKALLYARSDVAVVWVVDARARCVIVLTDPTAKGYGERRTVELDATLSSPVGDIKVADFV